MPRDMLVYPLFERWDTAQEHPNITTEGMLKYYKSCVLGDPVSVLINHLSEEEFNLRCHNSQLAEAEAKVKKRMAELEKAQEELAKLQCLPAPTVIVNESDIPY